MWYKTGEGDERGAEHPKECWCSIPSFSREFFICYLTSKELTAEQQQWGGCSPAARPLTTVRQDYKQPRTPALFLQAHFLQACLTLHAPVAFSCHQAVSQFSGSFCIVLLEFYGMLLWAGTKWSHSGNQAPSHAFLVGKVKRAASDRAGSRPGASTGVYPPLTIPKRHMPVRHANVALHVILGWATLHAQPLRTQALRAPRNPARRQHRAPRDTHTATRSPSPRHREAPLLPKTCHMQELTALSLSRSVQTSQRLAFPSFRVTMSSCTSHRYFIPLPWQWSTGLDNY